MTSDLSYAPVPRIDSLQPGDAVLLIFPAGPAPATFIMHNGTAEDRTATFSTRDPETGEPVIWDARRHNKRWVYGSAATPLKVLGRALPPPTLGERDLHANQYGAVQPLQTEGWIDYQFPPNGIWDDAVSSVALDGETQSDPRPFNTPNPTCICGEPATVPTETPNLYTCAECAENGSETS